MPVGVAVRCASLPAHTGPSLPAVRPNVLTRTFVVAVAEQPGPVAITVTVYVPDADAPALLRTGFCIPGKDVGPFHK